MRKEAPYISDAVIEYYKTHTAAETLTYFNMPIDRRHIKALYRHYPKGLGWGGARQGSGNKKGWIDKEKKP
jgi:hypothetical protein